MNYPASTALVRHGASYCFAFHDGTCWRSIPGRTKLPEPDWWTELATEYTP